MKGLRTRNFGVLPARINPISGRAELIVRRRTEGRAFDDGKAAGEAKAVDPGWARRPAMARSSVSSPAVVQPSAYDSQEEADYADELHLQKRAEMILDYVAHPFTVPLPGKRSHRPDFLVIPMDLFILEIHNFKGYHKNFRASLNAITEAAARLPWFRWVIIEKTGTRRYKRTVVHEPLAFADENLPKIIRRPYADRAKS